MPAKAKKAKPKLPRIPKPSRREDVPPPAPDQLDPPAATPPDLSHIPPALHGLAVPCESLIFDEQNCVEHDEANIEGIVGSLEEFGQRVLVVYNARTLVIEKGNGTVRAALLLSQEDPRWRYIAAIGFDDEAGKASAFSIADNRVAQLAKWRPEVLKKRLAEVRTNANAKLDAMMAQLAEKQKLIPAEESSTWPALGGNKDHTLTLRYTDEDEPILKAFIGQNGVDPLDPIRAGKYLLERIKEIVAAEAD